MKAFDKDGLLLCNLQATTFEMSIETESMSSEVFIRRFMNSQVAKDLDNESALQTSIQPQTIFEFVPYHSMEPSQAIERILEAKNLIFDEKKELERQYNIFKKIRNAQH